MLTKDQLIELRELIKRVADASVEVNEAEHTLEDAKRALGIFFFSVMEKSDLEPKV